MSVVLDPPTADGSAAPRRATPRVPIQARLRAEAASNAAAARSMPSDPVVVAAPPAPSPPASEPGPKGRRSPRESLRELVALSQPRGLFPVVMLLCLAAVERFDATALGVLAPEIEKSFHLSDAQFVPISTISGLVPLLFSLPLGYWSDRTGRVWLARLGGLVWGVTAVATGFAPAVAIFVIARLAGGSGQLVNEVTHPSLLSDFYRPKALAPIFGFYAIAQGGIALIAGPIAGALGGAVGWRPTFVILALPTFAFVVLLSRVEEPVRGATALLDRADDSDVAADTAPAPESSASSAVGVFGVLGEIIRDMAGAYRELSAIRSLRRTWLAAAFFGGGVAPFAVYLSLFFKKEYGVSPEVRGVISALFGTFGLLGVALGAKLAQDQVVRSRAERLPLVNGLMVIEFGVGVMFMAAAPNFALALVAVCFLSIGAAGFAPAYRTLVSLIVPARIRSQAFAWSLMFLLLGAAITSVLISAIGDSSGRSTALVLLGIIVVIGGVWSAAPASASPPTSRQPSSAKRPPPAMRCSASVALMSRMPAGCRCCSESTSR